jgi:hypothetical protein
MAAPKESPIKGKSGKGKGKGKGKGRGGAKGGASGPRRVRPIYDWEVRAAEAQGAAAASSSAAGGASPAGDGRVQLRVRLTAEELAEIKRRRDARGGGGGGGSGTVGNTSGHSDDGGGGGIGNMSRHHQHQHSSRADSSALLSRKEGGMPIDTKVPYLHSAAPYMDRSSLERVTDPRRPNRERWVAPGKDFVVSRKIDRRGDGASDELPLYLDAGCMYDDRKSSRFEGRLRRDGSAGATRHERSFSAYTKPLGTGVDVSVSIGAEPVLRAGRVLPRSPAK